MFTLARPVGYCVTLVLQRQNGWNVTFFARQRMYKWRRYLNSFKIAGWIAVNTEAWPSRVAKGDLETPLCKFGNVKCKRMHFTREIWSNLVPRVSLSLSLCRAGRREPWERGWIWRWSGDFYFYYTHSPPPAVQGHGRGMTETISKLGKKISLKLWNSALKLIIYRDSIWLTFGFILSKTSCRMVTKHCFSTTLSECVVDKTDQSGLSRRLKYITCKRVTSYS